NGASMPLPCLQTTTEAATPVFGRGEKSMRRVTLSVALVVAGACSGDIPVQENVCESACGVGFVCDAPRCVLSPDTVVEVEVLAPVSGVWLNEAEVTFQCRVKAPQVFRVLMQVTPAGAEQTEIELTRVP